MYELDLIEGQLLKNKNNTDVILSLEISKEGTIFETHLNKEQVDKLQHLLHDYYTLHTVLNFTYDGPVETS